MNKTAINIIVDILVDRMFKLFEEYQYVNAYGKKLFCFDRNCQKFLILFLLKHFSILYILINVYLSSYLPRSSLLMPSLSLFPKTYLKKNNQNTLKQNKQKIR